MNQMRADEKHIAELDDYIEHLEKLRDNQAKQLTDNNEKVQSV